MSNTTQPPADIEAQLHAIVELLDGPPDVLPEKAFELARAHKQEIIPRLIALIEKATMETRQRREASGNGHFLALFLLTEFRAKEALPAIVAAVSLPDEGPFDLFGDAITDDLSRVLAVLAWDRISDVLPLIRNQQINDYVRRAAAHSLALMVAAGLRERDQVMTILRELLREAVEQQDRELLDGLIPTLCELHPEEAYDEISDAYQRGLVEEWIMNLDDVKEYLARGRAEALKRLREQPIFMDDAVAELRDWAAFQPEEDEPGPEEQEPWSEEEEPRDESVDPAPFDPRPMPIVPMTSNPITNSVPRVGRNDPCPCGSGKKFKKCCGFHGRTT